MYNNGVICRVEKYLVRLVECKIGENITTLLKTKLINFIYNQCDAEKLAFIFIMKKLILLLLTVGL